MSQIISFVCSKLVAPNFSQVLNSMNTWTKYLNSHFSKEDVQMANEHMKGYWTSSVIREVQVKTTQDTISHLLDGWNPKRQKTRSAGENVEN